MAKLVRALATDESGATAIEYGLIAALIAIIAMVGMTTFGGTLSNVFNYTSNKATTVWDNVPN